MAKTVKKRKAPAQKSKPAKKTAAKAKKAPAGRAANRNDLAVGSMAPDFSMPGTNGTVSRTGLKGKTYVLYFYPKDDTSGCTAEACGFRDSIAQFNRLGAAIIGVSKDNLASHEKFRKKYDLNFPLASDETGKVCEKFGVWVKKSMYGRSYMGIERSTFLIDGKGVIRALWRKVSVPGHIDEVKKALQEL